MVTKPKLGSGVLAAAAVFGGVDSIGLGSPQVGSLEGRAHQVHAPFVVIAALLWVE